MSLLKLSYLNVLTYADKLKAKIHHLIENTMSFKKSFF